ncbi:MAG: hypothetical protein ACKVIU_09175 [Rhodobacterales bacterium]
MRRLPAQYRHSHKTALTFYHPEGDAFSSNQTRKPTAMQDVYIWENVVGLGKPIGKPKTFILLTHLNRPGSRAIWETAT